MNNKLLFRQIKGLKANLIAVVALALLETIAMLIQMVLLSQVVGLIFLSHQTLQAVAGLLWGLLGAIILHAVLVGSREIVGRRGAIRLKLRLREQLFSHLLKLGPSFSRNERSGELAGVMSEGMERVDSYISRYLPQKAFSVVIPMLIAIFIVSFDWISALLLVLTAPVIPLMLALAGRYTKENTQEQWAALTRMSAGFLEMLQGLPSLKIFGSSGWINARIEQFSQRLRRSTVKVLRLNFVSGAVLEFLTAVMIGLVAVTLGVRLINHAIFFEQAFLVLLLAPEFYRPLRELGAQYHVGMEGQIAAQRISEILATPIPQSVCPKSDGRNNAFPVINCIGGIDINLEKVEYKYPNGTGLALDGVSLRLTAGSCTALIGRSGAGKSTLVQLLLRFMETEAGCITANGIPIKLLSPEKWREYVAFVPQRPHLFYGSVLDNIRLARPNASQCEVEQAAELAGATDFIGQLPEGYATQIGERALRLSAGQAQRIAIARAFLKDAPLVMLDEPTSSLDPESESVIRCALTRLKQNRTVLVIAHRSNTIAHADQFAILENGRLVKVGSAFELRQEDRLLNLYEKVS